MQDDAFSYGLAGDDDPLQVDTDAEVAEVKYASVQLVEYLSFMSALRDIADQPQNSKNSCTTTVGRKTLIWGTVEGTFVTDIVTPFDYTEQLLTD
ncbi:MAG: hypothetical protein ACI9G5_000946 [Paracoccaceae bacterium]